VSATLADVVFLLDVDSTLLDDDRIVGDLRRHLVREFGATSAERYGSIVEPLNAEPGCVDDLGDIARYPGADFSVEHIGELADVNVAHLIRMEKSR